MQFRWTKMWSILTVERLAVMAGILLTGVIVSPAFRSADDGAKSREAAEWANAKEYKEYCEQVRPQAFSGGLAVGAMV